MDNNKIGKFIASLRKERKLTQKELGDKLFVTDKAVSKWERGLSLPDIPILEKLADALDTDIYSILQIEKKKNIDIEKILYDERKKIKKQITKKIALIMIPIIIVICIILFKLIPFSYDVIHVRYNHNDNKLINLGIPKFSFLMKNKENSYSIKSLRGKNILKSEIKSYLNTLEHISCNDTVYYYDNYADVTIIDYSVKGNLIYNTISYNIRNGNYCNTVEVSDYNEKLGIINRFKTLYADDSSLIVRFLPKYEKDAKENSWTANMHVYYTDENKSKIIEMSQGTFEIKDNELTYYRTKILDQSKDIDIPSVSKFIIKDQKLILEDNYLESYEKEIILN